MWDEAPELRPAREVRQVLRSATPPHFSIEQAAAGLAQHGSIQRVHYLAHDPGVHGLLRVALWLGHLEVKTRTLAQSPLERERALAELDEEGSVTFVSERTTGWRAKGRQPLLGWEARVLLQSYLQSPGEHASALQTVVD